MNASMSTSSQRHNRNLTRKCRTEGCARSVTRDGSLGLCGYCYRIAKRAEKQSRKSKRLSELHDDPNIILPVRRNFEWLGDLQESLRAMCAEEK